MKLIRFASNKQQRQFSISLRKNVTEFFEENAISMKANAAMVIKKIVMISMYIIPFILLLTISMNPWLACMLTALMGIGIAGIDMGVMHLRRLK